MSLNRERIRLHLQGWQPGRDAERRRFVLAPSLHIWDPDNAAPPHVQEFEAMFVQGRWRPLLDSQDHRNALRYEAERRRPIPLNEAQEAWKRQQFDRIQAMRAEGREPVRHAIQDYAPAEDRPTVQPYPWWRRLPLCREEDLNDALNTAVRTLHPSWDPRYSRSSFRLASLANGSFRDCQTVLTNDGYETGLVVKVPQNNRQSTSKADLHTDHGNGQETAIYLTVANKAPDLLQHFPTLYATEPEQGRWAIHEKVEAECYGSQDKRDLILRLATEAGVWAGDCHSGNLGRHPTTRNTLFIDYGHFTLDGSGHCEIRGADRERIQGGRRDAAGRLRDKHGKFLPGPCVPF